LQVSTLCSSRRRTTNRNPFTIEIIYVSSHEEGNTWNVNVLMKMTVYFAFIKLSAIPWALVNA
jgi:hypothetical protein